MSLFEQSYQPYIDNVEFITDSNEMGERLSLEESLFLATNERYQKGGGYITKSLEELRARIRNIEGITDYISLLRNARDDTGKVDLLKVTDHKGRLATIQAKLKETTMTLPQDHFQSDPAPTRDFTRFSSDLPNNYEQTLNDNRTRSPQNENNESGAMPPQDQNQNESQKVPDKFCFDLPVDNNGELQTLFSKEEAEQLIEVMSSVSRTLNYLNQLQTQQLTQTMNERNELCVLYIRVQKTLAESKQYCIRNIMNHRG